MKKLKCFIKILVYYIFGNVIFNLIFSITQIILINLLNGNENFINIFKDSLIHNLGIYTTLFILIYIIIIIYNMMLMKKLNEKLKKIKSGGDKHEE